MLFGLRYWMASIDQPLGEQTARSATLGQVTVWPRLLSLHDLKSLPSQIWIEPAGPVVAQALSVLQSAPQPATAKNERKNESRNAKRMRPESLSRLFLA